MWRLELKKSNLGRPYRKHEWKNLYCWLQDYILDVTSICHTSPSYPNGSSFLGHFLINNRLLTEDSHNIRITSMPSFSDLFPLNLELKLDDVEFSSRSHRCFTSFKNTNWQQFRHEMEEAHNLLMPPVNTKLSVGEIYGVINKFSSSINNIKHFFMITYSWQKELKKYISPQRQ